MDELKQLKKDIALAMRAIKELDDNLSLTDEEMKARGVQHKALAARVLAVECIVLAMARSQYIDWSGVKSELQANTAPVALDALAIVLQIEAEGGLSAKATVQ